MNNNNIMQWARLGLCYEIALWLFNIGFSRILYNRPKFVIPSGICCRQSLDVVVNSLNFDPVTDVRLQCHDVRLSFVKSLDCEGRKCTAAMPRPM